MKKFVAYIGALLLSLTLCFGQEYPKVAIAGDYGDPTIIREGKDYYMTHSAFSSAPGLLIWHSTDLLHWEPICRALPFVPGNVYAPDLVKYNGKYYIYFPAGSNYVIWADKITGPWSKPINLKVNKIDPGHAIGEDGRRYLFLNGGNRVNLTDDGLATDGAPMKIVYSGWDFPADWKTEGKWLESPKIVKHGEYFYLTSAEGGTAGPPTSHMVVSARSKSINGPWENSPYNPIVHTYSADEPWWSKGHGTIIDDVNGNWWIIYHAYKNGFYTLGRFNLVEPIEWTKDGWFKLAKKPVKALVNTVKNSGLQLSDDFAGKELGLQWTIWRQRTVDNFQLKDHSLYLDAKGVDPGTARKLVCIPADTAYRAEVAIQLGEGNSGGLLLSYNDKAFTGIIADQKNWHVYDTSGVYKEIPRTANGPIRLRIDNHSEHCTFSVSNDGSNWQTVASDVVVSGLQHNNYKGFLALKIALAAIGQGKVKFNDFKYQAIKHPVN